jgi:elongation factor Ts
MHVAAMKPEALSTDDLDADVVAKQREELSAAAKSEGKPENIIEKMVDGRMRNWYAERVLLEQPFVKDDKQSVGKVAKAAGAEIKQFVHWTLGDTE